MLAPFGTGNSRPQAFTRPTPSACTVRRWALQVLLRGGLRMCAWLTRRGNPRPNHLCNHRHNLRVSRVLSLAGSRCRLQLHNLAINRLANLRVSLVLDLLLNRRDNPYQDRLRSHHYSLPLNPPFSLLRNLLENLLDNPQAIRPRSHHYARHRSRLLCLQPIVISARGLL